MTLSMMMESSSLQSQHSGNSRNWWAEIKQDIAGKVFDPQSWNLRVDECFLIEIGIGFSGDAIALQRLRVISAHIPYLASNWKLILKRTFFESIWSLGSSILRSTHFEYCNVRTVHEMNDVLCVFQITFSRSDFQNFRGLRRFFTVILLTERLFTLQWWNI